LKLLTHEETKKMVTYFNKKDLVNFGIYLLSDSRKERIESIKREIPIDERLKNVYHADIENFLEMIKKIE
jgi:hypothetical protein